MSIRLSADGLQELGADLDKLGKHLPLAIRNALKGEGGEAIISNMRQMMPGKPGGRLQSGLGITEDPKTKAIYVGYLGPLSGGNKGGGRDQLGTWIESGTKPHEIKAEAGKSLLIAGSGQPVSSVNHPGIKPRRIGRKSIRMSMWEVEASIVDEINKINGGVA